MLTCELRLTAGAHKTLLMPRLIPVGHTTFGQGLKTQAIIHLPVSDIQDNRIIIF